MKPQYNNFIGQYREIYPEGYCQHLISEFERLDALGAGSNRRQSEGAIATAKNDRFIFMESRCNSMDPFNGEDTVSIFFNGLQECYSSYTDRFSSLINGGSIRGTSMKIQKTPPGGGYHVWHCEQGSNPANSPRVLVYMLYLNTLEANECGETEFLYQETRIKPEEGLLIIWPAAFTHTHRGNAVYGSNNKYVVTGWFTYD
jgi:hypothetical protein